MNFFDMSEIFYQNGESRFFDNLAVDVKKVYTKFPINKKINPKPNQIEFMKSYFHKLYRNSLIPGKIRKNLWYFLRQTNLDLTWFNEFKNYWTSILGGRPLLNVHDLYFLKNLFRLKFQNVQVPNTEDPYIHLEAWQRPELIYQLLHLVCKEFVSNQYAILKILRKKKKTFNSMLEFGCATAPITTSLFEFFKIPKSRKIYISDIQTLAFHYAIYKFRRCSNVIPLVLVPDNDFLLKLDKKN